MQNFNIAKKGYEKKEVEKAISDMQKNYENQLLLQKSRIDELKQELSQAQEELVKYKAQDKNISGALIKAVETAKEIENDSKNIYELEIKKLRVLYSKWENMFNELVEKHPDIKEKFNPDAILKSFNEAIDKTLKENFTSMKLSRRENASRAKLGIQSLLNKMNKSANDKVVSSSRMKVNGYKTATIARSPVIRQEVIEETRIKNDFLKEKIRVNQNKSLIKPISNVTLSKNDEYENVVDKYLKTNSVDNDSFSHNAYAKQLTKHKKKDNLYPEPNATGFDLKQALNPTEELGEIMKAFDFFDGDDE